MGRFMAAVFGPPGSTLSRSALVNDPFDREAFEDVLPRAPGLRLLLESSKDPGTKDLAFDLFCSLYKYFVKLLPADQVIEESRGHRDLLDRALGLREHEKLRAWTRPESAAPADRPFVRPLSSDGPGGSGGEGPPGERGGRRLRPRRRGRAGARGGTRELRDAGAGGSVLLEGRAASTPDVRTVAAPRTVTTRVPLPGQFRQHVGRERGLGQSLGAGARPHGPATRAARRDRAVRRCVGSVARRLSRSPRQGTHAPRKGPRCRVLFSRRWDRLPETSLPCARHDPGGTRGIRQ